MRPQRRPQRKRRKVQTTTYVTLGDPNPPFVSPVSSVSSAASAGSPPGSPGSHGSPLSPGSPGSPLSPPLGVQDVVHVVQDIQDIQDIQDVHALQDVQELMVLVRACPMHTTRIVARALALAYAQHYEHPQPAQTADHISMVLYAEHLALDPPDIVNIMGDALLGELTPFHEDNTIAECIQEAKDMVKPVQLAIPNADAMEYAIKEQQDKGGSPKMATLLEDVARYIYKAKMDMTHI